MKKLLTQKSFSKISVSEIIADCGVNRKTFYYHFQDIYDLLKWIFEKEAVEVLKGFDCLINLEEAIIFVMDYIDDNQFIINCVYDSIGRDEMKRFLYNDFSGIIAYNVDNAIKQLDINIDEKFKDLVVSFYTEALAGMLIEYLKNKEKYTREEWLKYTLQILKNSLPNILKSYKE